MVICNAYCYLGRPLPLSLREFYLMDIYINSIQRYTPKLYQGSIILYNSDQVSYGEGAKQMTAGGVEVHHIIGSNHDSIRREEPYVRIWAEHLNRYILEFQAKKKDNKK
jgi:hypothetical protein